MRATRARAAWQRLLVRKRKTMQQFTLVMFQGITASLALASASFASGALAAEQEVKLIAQSDPTQLAPAPPRDVVIAIAKTTAKRPERKIAITISALKMALGIPEISVESKVRRRISVAGSLAVGDVAATYGTNETDRFFRGPYLLLPTRVALAKVGFSPRWYALGDFDHGIQLGVDLSLVVGIQHDLDKRYDPFIFNHPSPHIGLGVAPFVGYKYTAPFGLTVELQAGVGASSHLDGGLSLNPSNTSMLIPAGNGLYVHAQTNIGWSLSL